ncbi:hypothetical protein A6A08_09420 [Nocardiopsis sp. TSRI0078]|uniref:hypothetical protein n=1 Tax=unclassified Nocardiopsis TaxID=2649073 RepID=UPI00095AEA09|nr:hypothetical protein [Nocardiopsis sp. TSRI0078]OKI15769.1 hypothetical protein A6A08_09420 [Nocardiopsis sp. TSRI0078]
MVVAAGRVTALDADAVMQSTRRDGGPGLLFTGPDRVIATVTLDFDAAGRTTAVHNAADPGKPGAVAEGTAHDLGTR